MKTFAKFAVGLLHLAGFTVGIVIICRDLFSRETADYFSSQPQRVIYVAALALTGGVVAWVFGRLSRGIQWWGLAWIWGVAASVVTGFTGYFWLRLVDGFALVEESGGIGPMLLLLSSFTAVSVYLWFELRCRLKHWNEMSSAGSGPP